MAEGPRLAQGKQSSSLRKIATALVAFGLTLVIVGIVFGDPWNVDGFWDPIRAAARGVGALAVLAGVLGWLYLALPQSGADAGKLWRRSKASAVAVLVLCILVAAELVRIYFTRIKDAPIFFVIFLSFILLLVCKTLVEIALSLIKFLEPVNRGADGKRDRLTPPL
jgi:hypothetical protein